VVKTWVKDNGIDFDHDKSEYKIETYIRLALAEIGI